MCFPIKKCFLSVLLFSITLSWAQDSDSRSAADSGRKSSQILRLSLKDAVDIAVAPDGNIRLQIAEEMVHQAKARASQSRAALLPNVDSYVTQQDLTRNLQTFGIQQAFSGQIPNFEFPQLVGPYSVFDARASATQSIFNLSSIKRYQASRSAVGQAESERENADDQVRYQVARFYLAALRAQATVDSALANTELADALLKLAQNQKSAGTGTGIEITRADVQLANERQRLLVAHDDLNRARLELLRTIGLDLNLNVELTEKLGFLPVTPPQIPEAIQIALASRPDWKAQQLRQETARLNSSAIKFERIPSLSIFGDYGTTGLAIDNAVPTRVYGFRVQIPIFDGGRMDARRAESSSQLQQEMAETRDLRAQIELEIRLALDSLRSAEEQVKTAQEGLRLSEDELNRAQRRFKAGVGSSIEVTDAQTRLERAQDNRIQALFNYNLARIDLNTAMGTIEQMIEGGSWLSVVDEKQK
jgi:outer membrane protein